MPAATMARASARNGSNSSGHSRIAALLARGEIVGTCLSQAIAFCPHLCLRR
jgi:hypothetical protein